MDPKVYFNQECYALDNCMHCADCLSFALKFFHETSKLAKDKNRRKELVVKFILSTVAKESLPCPKALSSEELKDYINKLFEGRAELPIGHYEFRNE